MLDTSFSSWPAFSDEEIAAVSDVLRSNRVNYWTGDVTRKFEHEFANWSNTTHAVALGNGTQALEAALRALEVGDGDEVIVTPRSFFASASCIVATGASPVFADVDRDSQNITAKSIEKVLSPKTRAIIAVHLAGWPCDMDDIVALAEEHQLDVIEDCAQAHGARYRGREVGSIGKVGAWSFCQDKIITTGGEGGMVTTNEEEIWSRVWSYKDHGKSWEAVYEREHSPGFRWVHESFGTNMRMLEMQAAIGRIQLQRVSDWHRRRSDNASRLAVAFSKCSTLRVPTPPNDVEHAWYKFHAFIQPEALQSTWTRERIMAEILAAGVPCQSGSCSEVYLEKAFDGTGLRPANRLPVARELGETSLMFLVHPNLTEAEIDQTCNVVTDVARRAMR
jgi:dTDP-4-amino-4,6-dideoxygalactose transaminase